MKRLLLVVVTIAGFLSLPAMASGQESVYWKHFDGSLEIEPVELTTSWGTSSSTLYFEDLKWERWGEDIALGTGTALVNSCRPFCLAGNYVRGDAKVWLSNIRSVCGPRRYMHVKVSVSNLPNDYRSFIEDYPDVTCKTASMANPGGNPFPNRVPKPKRPTVRTCGLLPGEGAYGYIKTRGIRCQPAWKISRRVRRKFCAQNDDCNFAPYTPSSITRTYRGRVNRNGWKCSAVVKWEFFRTICRKKDMLIRSEGGA